MQNKILRNLLEWFEKNKLGRKNYKLNLNWKVVSSHEAFLEEEER